MTGAPHRLASLVVGLTCAALGVCVAHGIYLRRASRLEPALSFVRRLDHADLCIAPDDDLRHPGWGRSEHGKIAQPLLVDPRLGAHLVRPPAVRVVR